MKTKTTKLGVNDRIALCVNERIDAGKALEAAIRTSALAAINGDQGAYDAAGRAERAQRERLDKAEKDLRDAIRAAGFGR